MGMFKTKGAIENNSYFGSKKIKEAGSFFN